MLRVNLSDQWTAWAIDPPEFWYSIINDPELHPEIRDNSVSVYYRGAALIRNLSLAGSSITGDVHYKYVPIQEPTGSHYVKVIGTPDGFAFKNKVEPLPLKNCAPQILSAYKQMMRSVVNSPELHFIHNVVSHSENIIIDQVITLQTTSDFPTEMLNLCHYDTHHKCNVFVKVSMIHDPRLKADPDHVPEIIQQLKRFREQIEKHHHAMIETSQTTVAIKRQIGLSERVEAIPLSGPSQLMRKVLLVIGGCSQHEIESVLNGEGEWSIFRDTVEKEAAGLILCGTAGCTLKLEAGSQSLIFDTSVYNATHHKEVTADHCSTRNGSPS